MSSRLRNTCTGAFALFMALWLSGGHWVILQVTAWSGMVITRTAQEGVVDALTSTFDGSAPCKLCEAIKRAQHEEDKPDAPAKSKDSGKWKIEAATLADAVSTKVPNVHMTAGNWQELPAIFPAQAQEPPVPPPRLFVA